MSKPLFLIVGESGSGKTTLNEMLEQREGLKQIQSYTTRPPRTEAETGHIFVNKEGFSQLKDVLAYTEYLGNEYGVTKEQIDNEDYILYTIDPVGVKYLKKNYKGDRKLIVIYIKASYDARLSRVWERHRKMFDSINANIETNIRLVNDEEAFKNVECIADFKVENSEDIELAYKYLLNIIKNVK